MKLNQKLISENEIDKVLNNLLNNEFVKSYESYHKSIIILANRYRKEKTNELRGQGTDSIERNKIVIGILEVLSSLKKTENERLL